MHIPLPLAGETFVLVFMFIRIIIFLCSTEKKNFSVLCEKFLILHELLYSGFFVLIKLSCTTQKKTQRDIIKFLECKFHSEWIFKFRSAHVYPSGGAGVEMHTSMWIFYSNKMTNVMIKSSKLLRKVLDGGETYSDNLKQHFSFPAHLQLLAREFWRFLLSQRTIHFSPALPQVYVGCNMHHCRDAARIFYKHWKVVSGGRLRREALES